ncbi:MAG: GNAT family N-acetyltransferase [Candidatus Thorarchaeota archaeon]|nr:GNAT family N-acetyltransferase [Candidatus Thorarchaeota archaeon]
MSRSSPFPILETQRLILRQLTVDDSENWFKNLSDDEVAVLIGMEPLENVEESKSIIKSFSDRYEKRNGIAWAIVLKEDYTFIGTCSYEKIDKENRSGEIGYDLLKEYWGRGFMTEALRIIIEYGFENLNLNRIEAHTAAINMASRDLLRRLGFSEEGISRDSSFFRGEFRDDCYYSLLRREWTNPNKI